jgi:hypothetical protein
VSDEGTKKIVAEQTAEGGALIAGGLAAWLAHITGATPEQVALSGWFGVVAPYMQQAVQWGAEELAERKLLFEATVRSERGIPPESPPFEGEELADPHVRRTIFETLQQLMSHGERCVIPVIGRLAAEYVSERKRPDEFFRGMGRMLSVLSCSELSLWQQFISKVAGIEPPALPGSAPGNEISLDYWTKDVPAPVVRCAMTARSDEGKLGWQPIAEFADVRRLFRLMKANELGNEGRDGAFGSSSGPHRIDLDREVV